MRRETEENGSLRRQLCRDYQESGESMSAFSRTKGIPFWKLRAAIKKTESETTSPSSNFQEIITIPARVAASEYAAVLRNGRVLKIPATFEDHCVRRLVAALEGC